MIELRSIPHFFFAGGAIDTREERDWITDIAKVGIILRIEGYGRDGRGEKRGSLRSWCLYRSSSGAQLNVGLFLLAAKSFLQRVTAPG